MDVNKITDEGVMLLAIAIIEQAREEYNTHITYGNYISARIAADRDSRGLLGYILGYALGDHEFLKKEVERSIQLERRKLHGTQRIQ